MEKFPRCMYRYTNTSLCYFFCLWVNHLSSSLYLLVSLYNGVLPEIFIVVFCINIIITMIYLLLLLWRSVIIIEFNSKYLLFTGLGSFAIFHTTILKSLCRFFNTFAAIFFFNLKSSAHIAMMDDCQICRWFLYMWREFHRCIHHSTYCLWIEYHSIFY